MTIYDNNDDRLFITAIRRQKGGLYGIWCNGECIASLDEETLVGEDALAAGQYISEAELERIIQQSGCRQARKKALSIVARKEVCSSQLENKLKECGYDEEAVQYALEEMIRLNLVNDRRCAEMMAEDIYHLRHFGRRRCAFELTRKGIDKELAELVASELEPDAQEEIYALLTGKLARDMDSEAGIRRCYNTLFRYGYEASDVSDVLRRLEEELEDE